MSLLEQMKIQAQKALEDQEKKSKLSSKALADRNAKLRQIFDYWREFADITKIIQPVFPKPIALPRVGEMTGLKVIDLFADYRHLLLKNQNFSDEIDHASLNFYYKAPNAFKFQRDIGLATLVKDELWRYGVFHTSEDLKNERERTVNIAFEVPWEIKGSLTVAQQMGSTLLRFSLKNVAKFGEIELEVPYNHVNIEFLDELSKLLLGQDNNFWSLAKFQPTPY